MEPKGGKRKKALTRARVPLDLDRLIPIRDVRQLVWRKLTPYDREMVRCAHNSERIPDIDWRFMLRCARLGYVKLLELGYDHELNVTYQVMRKAGRGGHLETFQWVCAHFDEWCCLDACAAIAMGGNLLLLQWARTQGCSWDFQTPANAACKGHLHVLQWIHTQECELDDPWICASAAVNGHLGVLQWLRANDYPWDTCTCWRAAQRGHLSVLKWARANGCPWDHHVVLDAKRNGHMHVVEWARANGCPE